MYLTLYGTLNLWMLLSFFPLATFVLHYLTFFFFFISDVLLVIWASRPASAVTVAFLEVLIRTLVLHPVCARYQHENRHSHWRVLCLNLSTSYISSAPAASHWSTPSLLPFVMPAGKCRRRELWPLQSGLLQSSTWQSVRLWEVLLYGCVQSLHWIHMDLSKCRQ